MLVGLDDWCSIAEFGHAQEAWLRTFLPLENGIPSHDIFGRVFSLISPKEFEKAFFAWAQKYLEVLAGTGKKRLHERTIRGTA